MQIVFTIEQLNQLLSALGEVPSKYGIGLIEFIKKVAEPQIAEQQPKAEETPAE